MRHLNQKIAVILFCLLGTGCLSNLTTSDSKKYYSYMVEAGSPNSYPMIYVYGGNYFFNAQGDAFLKFSTPGGGSSVVWGYGTQATSISEVNPLPYGINVRWFSVTENEFWEGRYVFDQQVFQKLTQHEVDNLLFRTKIPFTRFFKLKVYVTPDGLVTVWAAAEGEQFLVGQFYAEKMVNEPDWNEFSASPISGKPESRQEYIKTITENTNNFIKVSLDGKAEKFTIEQSKPYTAKPWLRTMKGYYWQLTVNDYFQLKDYLAWYVNGEKIFTYFGDDQLAMKRTVPYDFTLYFEDKNNNSALERIDFELDADEVMQAFQTLGERLPIDQPISLFVDVQKEYKGINFYVIKGTQKIKLNKILKAQRHDLYNH